ncbi:DUF6597 domain-containing transcriptional factor [Parapedobacter sp. DT-150]|uniref:DUF6597 domain-containing transcriptional factor n=1 Tax=Parapedobacter sp. DT-150 TaxID=3396162 RepID=UPI003F1D0ECF
MNYQLFEPSKVLSPLVKCYWTLESPKEESPQRQTIVPDGCMEMIFHYGDLYKQYMGNGQSVVQPRSCVFGQLTEPLEIEPTGETGMFSVRFHPGGFIPFGNLPLKEMDNKAVALEKLFGNDGTALESAVLNAKTTAEKISAVESFLSSRLTRETIDRFVQSAVETILGANGQLSVDELSGQIKINRRQLERKFLSAVGLSPKQLSKTIRLQTTLKLLLTKQYTSLTALAYAGEYYDQAHFIRDFKEFTGLRYGLDLSRLYNFTFRMNC